MTVQERIIVVGMMAMVSVALLSQATNGEGAAPQVAASVPMLSFSKGKVCSGAVGGRFRDSVNVPDNYRVRDCERLAKKLVLTVARTSKGFTYNLGCLTDHGYTWGENDGRAPSSNPCGWSE